LKLKNSTNKKRKLSIYSFAELLMGFDKEQTQMHVATSWDAESQSMFAYNRYNPDYGDYLSFFSCTPLADSYTGNRNEFLGRNGHLSSPASLKRKKLSSHVGAAIDPCSALHVGIELAPSEEKELIFILGYAKNESIARDLVAICKVSDWVNNALLETIKWWDKHLEIVQVNTPDPGINFAFNRWLLYQNLSCRFWGRTAFYQSSGAYGFRDQLQDAMGLLYAYPKLAREQILRAASRQFEEGDVQHWWHPPKNGGVRTRISDDLLWLPYVTAQYIRVTKDASILDEEVFFIKGDPLKEDQHETYFVPEVSTEKATILEHCRRALQKGLTEGPHGLPLIGGGDWNDGMNRVGIEGKGESVWLAWFLIHVMNDFADILELSGQIDSGEGYRKQAKRLAQVIEEKAWDGEWYRRAYYDDGTPIGSHTNIDARIDSLAQSWSIISKAGNKERSDKAMESLEKHLIKLDEKMVLLLTPPFDKGVEYPGYIKGYPPGVRENGGQYTHGSLWVPLAFAMQGNEEMALKLIRLMHPVSHTSNPEDMQHFKGEPYVLAADIYDLPGQVGRVGWTWYTGSGAWMYRILLENIFGFTLRGTTLSFKPVIPKDWPQVSMKYRYQDTLYNIVIERSSENSLELDGQIQPEKKVELVNDKKMHEIKIKIN
jgi:cellobiose phosphorylase